MPFGEFFVSCQWLYVVIHILEDKKNISHLSSLNIFVYMHSHISDKIFYGCCVFNLFQQIGEKELTTFLFHISPVHSFLVNFSILFCLTCFKQKQLDKFINYFKLCCLFYYILQLNILF